jgi:Zn-dependent peptidase ImmA (M78 family)
VDVRSIARSIGITVVERTMEDETSAMLIGERGTFYCVLNRSDHRLRKTFSIAHEIGHFALHAAEDAMFVDMARGSLAAMGVNPQEIEANVFAANLLMPAFMVRAYLQRYHPELDDDRDLRAMARTFGVSASAMTYRLINLGHLSEWSSQRW